MVRRRVSGWWLFLFVPVVSIAAQQDLDLRDYSPAYGWTKTASLDLGGERVIEWQPRFEETVLRVVRARLAGVPDLEAYTTRLGDRLESERKKFKLDRQGADRIHDLKTQELICTFRSDALRTVVKHHVIVFMSGDQVYRIELTAPKDRYDAHHSVLLNTAMELGKRLLESPDPGEVE